MILKYRIKYKWPDGKIRYRKAGDVCKSVADAETFSWADAQAILKNSHDAYLVWGIVATKERVK